MKNKQPAQFAVKEAVLILKNGTRLISAIIYDIHDENRKTVTLGSPTELIYDKKGSAIPIMKAFEFESDDDLYHLAVDDVEKTCEPWEEIAKQYTLFQGLTGVVGAEAASSILADARD